MPYCMYFSEKGYAVHGSYEVPDHANASHGCVRILPSSAKWLSENFIDIGTTVIVLPYNG
jgi:lipoprotein-anchoring transpeptidase ErfK/SrfK